MGGAFLLLLGRQNESAAVEAPAAGAGYFASGYLAASYFGASYLGAGGGEIPPAVCAIAPVLLLLPPDDLLYPHDFSCYREVEVRATDGEPRHSESVLTVNRAPCYFQEGQSQQGTNGGFMRAETDNLFTYDTVRMHLGRDVRGQDVLRAGPCAPEPGRYYRVEGNAKKLSHLGRFQDVLTAKLEERPDWVPET